MNTKYFYLDVEISGEESRLGVRQVVQAAVTELFGQCGGAAVNVDVLKVAAGRALLRVPAGELRRLRAALALQPGTLRVLGEAPTLLALI